MNKLIAILIVSVYSAAATSTAEIPLPDEVVSAMKKWNPKFAPFKSSDYSDAVKKKHAEPAIASADFNGDGKTDFAVFGELEKDRQAVVAILSNKEEPANWIPVVVNEYEIENVKKGDVPSGKGMQKGVSLYLTVAEDAGLAGDYKRVNKRDVLQVQANMGGITQFVIEHSKALRLRPTKK